MGLDIGGNTITQASSVLTINTGASMRILSAGGVSSPSQVQFQAIGTGDWVYLLPNGQWHKMLFGDVRVNTNACYASSRFTAPVAGSYFFQASCFMLKDGGASDAYYFHPVFAVNGSTAGGTANANTNYRLRGYGQPIATYLDSDIRQIYQLAAGDYVEHWVYSTGAAGGNRYYGPQSRFTGCLLG
jgi:hypothetical protein